MKVLVACEESQEVCKAFRKLGHEAYSCDIIDCSGGHPEWHIKGNVLKFLGKNKYNNYEGWDLMIAFVPCTRLCVSGARWHKKFPEEVKQAIKFFMDLCNSDIPKIAIENPIGIMSTRFRKPNQIIRPCMFGENSYKGTCLWLKNIENLVPTKVITPTRHITKTNKSYDEWWFKTCLITDLKERAKVRSKTFPGIAKAMAEQWHKPEVNTPSLSKKNTKEARLSSQP